MKQSVPGKMKQSISGPNTYSNESVDKHHRVVPARSTIRTSSLRSACAAFVLFCVVILTGCSTPNLTPFSDATKSLSSTITRGGDLAIKPLARMQVWDGAKYVQPGDPNHPAKALATSWALRRKTMDAVLVYSSSLASINEAAAHRKENATALVGSVKQLASSVPTIGTGVSAAGDLIVFGLGAYVEVKAWHDMRKAVESADPAIQIVAKGIKKDLIELSNEFQSKPNDQLIQLDVALRPTVRIHDALIKQRDLQRTTVAKTPADVAAGAELARLDGLVAATETDLNKLEEEKKRIQDMRADGLEFFSAAIQGVDAWAAAHCDLVIAFRQNRTPNLALLVARGEELKEIVAKLKQ